MRISMGFRTDRACWVHCRVRCRRMLSRHQACSTSRQLKHGAQCQAFRGAFSMQPKNSSGCDIMTPRSFFRLTFLSSFKEQLQSEAEPKRSTSLERCIDTIIAASKCHSRRLPNDHTKRHAIQLELASRRAPRRTNTTFSSKFQPAATEHTEPPGEQNRVWLERYRHRSEREQPPT